MSEERAHRPFRDLIRHTLVYGSGYVTMAAVSAILTPVYAHQLTPSDFGLLALLLVLYGLMKQVYDLGFTNSVGRFFFDQKDGEITDGLGVMRLTGLMFLAAWGALLTFLLAVPAGAWSQLLTGDAGHADLVRIVAATLYAETLAIVPLTLMRMAERSVAFVSISVARFAATLVLSVIFVAWLDWGVRGALLGNAIPAAALVLLLLPEYLVATASRPSRNLLRRMLAFGLPFFPVMLAAWIIEASDRYLLEVFRTREEVGWYALSYRIAAVMQIAVAAFSMGWAPLRYKIFEREDAPALYGRLATYFVLAGSLMAVALSVFAEEVVALIAPSTYAPAADVIPLLGFAYVMGGLYLLMTTGMGVVKKTAPLAWIAAAGAAVNIGLNVVLIPVWGIHAAAATTVLANAVLIAGAWFYSQRVYPIPYDWPRIARITAIGAVAVLVARLGAPSGVALSAGWAAICWLAFVLALVLTRTITREELARVRAAPGALRARLRERMLIG
jgi:O-antigen/teichoic acid export membrane protein